MERYNQLYDILANKGIEVFAFDQRGAGKTSEKREYWGLTDEKKVFKDIDALIAMQVKPDFDTNSESSIPWYMMGFSMVSS